MSLPGCQSVSTKCSPPLKTVDKVDINKYLGKWYEIASLPQWFQRNCFGSTANYFLREDGDIGVVNSCFEDSVNGPIKRVRGKAWAVDSSNSKLQVQFFWPFRGDYWIIELGENYDYAVVGNPTREYLWILSRSPQISEDFYNKLIETIKLKHNYTNLDELKKTMHPEITKTEISH